MAVVSRYNSKQLFFSEKLLSKLNTIQSESITVVEAPLGYGKTTAIRHFFEESDLTYVWMNVETRDNFRFFEEFCTSIRYFDEHISDRLKAAGCPVDDETCDKDVSILKDIELKEKSYLIIDNYQNISDEMMNHFFVEISSVHKLKLRVVLITQTLGSYVLREKIESGELNYISKQNFEFTEEEILRYYRKCGIRLSEEEAGYLQKYTDGWISAIYLQMLHYIENMSFESNIGINQLIRELFWEKMSINSQDLLIKLGLFEGFTLRQAVMLADGTLDEDSIKQMLSSNQLIYYDNIQHRYYIHGLMRYFLESEFDKMEPIFQNDIYEKAGNWYVRNEEYFKALKIFYRIGDYESIYKMDFGIGDIEIFLDGKNKDMFLAIIANTSTEIKSRHMETAMVLCLALFIYHEKDFFESECRELERCIKHCDFISERKCNVLKGECELLNALNSYNNLDVMRKHYEKACEYMQFPTNLMSSSISWTFKTPSVLCNLYRSDRTAMQQLEMFEKIVPYYYKLTGGQGKGAEALMKAEIFLNQMDFESAEILCHKALYMAETRHQFNVYIAAMFCLGRISVYRGDFENVRFILRTMSQKMEETQEYRENIVVDMAESYIKVLLGMVFEISGWLKDNAAIEKKCVVFNMGFANIIYGRYLIENREYVKFAGISGQMLGIAGIYDNIIYKIYTYIYISVTNYQLGQEERAVSFLEEAIGLAKTDNMYLPLVENIHLLKPVLELSRLQTEDFIQNLYEYEKIYADKFKEVKRDDYGLTRREEEIAKLAAERFTNKEIALRLHISENTVKSNLKVVFSKLNIKSRSELNKYF